MKSLSLDELRELAPGFVMGTLSAEELAEFNAAMSNDATAAELAPEIEAHRAAMEFLATEHAVTPPASLRGRVESRIASEHISEQRSAETAESPAALPNAVPTAVHVKNDGGAKRATVFTPPRPQLTVSRGNAKPAWIISGVFALAAAAAVVFALDLRTRVQNLESELASQARLTALTAERLASRDSTVNALISAQQDLVLVRLVANADAGPSMQVFWNQRGGYAVVSAANFAQVAANRTYCLWIIRNGKPEPVKLFNPDANGNRLINTVLLPRDVGSIAAFAVTEEPAEGSPQPTMTPFLVGAVPAPAAAPK